MPANFTIAEDNRTYDLSGQAGPLMEILQILKANGIGLNNMIDLRSNPAARAQVQAVVRRAARGTAGACPAPGLARPPRRPWRRPSRPPRSGCKNWRRCAPPARSPTTNTTPSVSRSWPISSRIPESVYDGNGTA